MDGKRMSKEQQKDNLSSCYPFAIPSPSYWYSFAIHLLSFCDPILLIRSRFSNQVYFCCYLCASCLPLQVLLQWMVFCLYLSFPCIAFLVATTVQICLPICHYDLPTQVLYFVTIVFFLPYFIFHPVKCNFSTLLIFRYKGSTMLIYFMLHLYI